MKVFLSYASEHQTVADEISLALTGARHEVIFDQSWLKPGDDYNRRICDAFDQADGMVFLITPEAVQAGSYALTELKFAREKWSHPEHRVLPVMLRPTPLEVIPTYLRAVTILRPEGNVAAEVASALRAWGSAVPQGERQRPPTPFYKNLFEIVPLKWVLLTLLALAIFVTIRPYSLGKQTTVGETHPRALDPATLPLAQTPFPQPKPSPQSPEGPIDGANRSQSQPFSGTEPSRERGQPQGDTPIEPEMVVIPAGSFLMGSPKQEQGHEDKEEPQHRVTFVRPFLIGKYEVTFDEYDWFVQETKHRSSPVDKGWGRGNRPVINVSWRDADDYVNWLAQLTGKSYRLPSEAEWEYAARAGTTTAHFWGDNQDQEACYYANVYDRMSKRTSGRTSEQRWHFDCHDGFAESAPVGRFKANDFGLYDMLGNVWEWTKDCWHLSYTDAPTDGAAWTTEECGEHVVRGGSWTSERGLPKVALLRFAGRQRKDIEFRNGDHGFRVARDLGD